MRKNNSKNNNKSEVKHNNNNIDISAINNSRNNNILNNNDMFNNEQQQKVITVDMSRVTQIDYMNMSRIAMFKKAVRLDMSYEKIVRYDILFYSKTNDRSVTQTQEKKNNLYEYCFKNRTSKQLRDVLKLDTSIIAYLNKKYDKQQAFFTVSEYKQLVK